MPHVHESQFSEWAEPFPGANYLRQTLAVAEADLRKLIHDPVELLTRMVQPVLWLLIFGQVFNRTRAIPHRRDQLSGFHVARNPRAKRFVWRNFLWDFADLGA